MVEHGLKDFHTEHKYRGAVEGTVFQKIFYATTQNLSCSCKIYVVLVGPHGGLNEGKAKLPLTGFGSRQPQLRKSF